MAIEIKTETKSIWSFHGMELPIRSPLEIPDYLRRKGHEIWWNRSLREELKKPLSELVDVCCNNPTCTIQNFTYQAYDLTSLLPANLQWLKQDRGIKGPTLGPCVVCNEFTIQVPKAPVDKVK
ncbi:hypothetical protein HYS94_03010 [Candidatus Daviesbacteria bacterium]|nr:hypothetical protein [Candidatus Daviesbacteria bacterium]